MSIQRITLAITSIRSTGCGQMQRPSIRIAPNRFVFLQNNTPALDALQNASLIRRSRAGRFSDAVSHSSMIATARVQPAEARSILTGKHDTAKPVDGKSSRLCSFSMWQ